MLSRVVPGWSKASTRSSPSRRLIRVDLPTLGRPTMAIRVPSGSGEASADTRSGRFAASRSDNWPRPRRCSAEVATVSPKPSEANSARPESTSRPSILLATSTTGLPVRRNSAAISSSSAVRPARASTMNATRSASSMARRDCWAVSASMPSMSDARPPVSTTITETDGSCATP